MMPDGYSYFNEKADLDEVVDRHAFALAEANVMLSTEGHLPEAFCLVAVYGDGKPVARASVAGLSGQKFLSKVRAMRECTLQLLDMLEESLGAGGSG